MIHTIAIEREYGCGAGAISQALANRLGWALWDNEITCEIARRLQCDVASVERREEKVDPNFYRLAKIFMRGSYEDRYHSAATDLLDADTLSRLFETIVTDVADKKHCVVVGRAAPWFLRERNDVMALFLYAPYEEKLRRTVARGRSETEAEELLSRVDRDRAAFVKRYYGKTWPQRDLYDLMINTQIGDAAVVDLILYQLNVLNRFSKDAA